MKAISRPLPEPQVEMIMTVQHLSPKPMEFQDMMALSLDVSFFTSEFHLCDVIAEYLADIVAQSHEDPARYANFSSQLINEIVEVAFSSARAMSKVDFKLVKNGLCIRFSVGFLYEKDSSMPWATLCEPAAASPRHPVHDLIALAQAIEVDIHAEADADDRVLLVADFHAREAVH